MTAHIGYVWPNHPERIGSEVFVGNVADDRDLSHLVGVRYRLGAQAYALNGEPVTGFRPLFLADATAADAYDRIMNARLAAIRSGR